MSPTLIKCLNISLGWNLGIFFAQTLLCLNLLNTDMQFIKQRIVRHWRQGSICFLVSTRFLVSTPSFCSWCFSSSGKLFLHTGQNAEGLIVPCLWSFTHMLAENLASWFHENTLSEICPLAIYPTKKASVVEIVLLSKATAGCTELGWSTECFVEGILWSW